MDHRPATAFNGWVQLAASILFCVARVFGKVQGRFQTPMIGTLILASLCLFGIFLRAISPAVNNG
jgi:hypothetical protein